MSLRKIPNDIQTLLRASNKITSYKRAIEELVYNSLDATSTSIAIRISIEENVMQVIDNGCGLARNDFVLLGQKHTTSKFVDLTALKSAPNKYGFRGQALANIIEVSQTVKVTSRHGNSEDTWCKTFYKGKEQNNLDSKQRPSKGTTVEIKGFLYNLNIQKKLVNALSEIHDIKHFLEQLSLVHSNTSLSLRDDTKNEIIFKIHKNRNIYQTLSSIYGIIKTDIQELKVEKNQYKITAFIGKADTELNKKQWVFLNGKIVQNGKLQSILNDNLSKSFKLKFQKKKKFKSKNGLNGEDNELLKDKIPFYLVFVSCPYYDYDVSYTPKQSVLEFKNWDQISKLLEKLVKFYVGDVSLKEIKPPVIKQAVDKDKGNEIRNEVKKIMNKILGSDLRRPAVSQMQNGIKGKLAKRKIKKKNLKISLSKIIPPQTRASVMHKDINNDKVNDICENDLYVVDIPKNVLVKENIESKNLSKIKAINKRIENEEKLLHDNTKNKKEDHRSQLIENMNNDKKDKTVKLRRKSLKRLGAKEKIVKNKVISSKKPKHIQKKKYTNREFKINLPKDPLLERFEKVTHSIKQRCSVLSKQVEDLLSYKKKRKQKIVVKETVQYSNIIKDNKNVSVRKKIEEIVLHDYVPLPPNYSSCSFDNRVWDGLKKKPCKSSCDLVKTILKTQKTTDHTAENPTFNYSSYSSDVNRCLEIPLLPRLTYDSHIDRFNHSDARETVKNNINKHFITAQSKDNFIMPSNRQNTTKRYKTNVRKTFDFKHKKGKKKSIFDVLSRRSNSDTVQRNREPINTMDNVNVVCTRNFQQESIAIDFSTRSNDYLLQNCSKSFAKTNEKYFLDDGDNSDHHLTYTYNEQKSHVPLSHNYKFVDETYTLDTLNIIPNGYNHQRYVGFQENLDIYRSDESYTRRSNSDTVQRNREPINTMDNVNVVFVSDSQECLIRNSSEINVEPLDICEIVHSQDVEITERSIHQKNDNLFSDELYINSSLLDKDTFISAPKNSSKVNIKSIENASNYFYNQQTADKVTTACGRHINIQNTTNPLEMYDSNKMDGENFNITNRLRFVPKGMSPIFQNCQTRNVCDFNLNEDYYEKTLYDNFANNVQVTSEILQPGVQNVKELTTKEIQKADNKLKKDNASLIFNGDSLKQAMVLGQVDEKFVAAQIKGRCYQSLEISEYLVLFDQHAVHERIKLENNLADYLIDDKWKSITLDGFILKLSKENILYLNNYKEKFSKFGLDWTVLNDREVSVSAIPKAILGKNPRQVEVVMKAVKNIISEEINTIKLQKGCVSLYPKSIMDLVFSEACRYAIKFGDKLSKKECVELLYQLSECKTPFQCAHGRPVMSVLMELKRERRYYAIHTSKLSKFARP